MELLFPGVDRGVGWIWPLPVQPCVYYGIRVFKQLQIPDSKANELHFHACTLTSMYEKGPHRGPQRINWGPTQSHDYFREPSYPVNSCTFTPNKRRFRNEFRLTLLDPSTIDRM